jgi:two-component system, sensor histidine kinase
MNEPLPAERSIECMVQRETRRAMFRAMPLTLGGNLMMALLLFFLVRERAPEWVRFSWLAIAFLQLGVPAIFMLRGGARRGATADRFGWIGALQAGVLWGVGCGLLYAHASTREQVLILFVVAGMGMGGIYAMGFNWLTYSAFIVPAVLPLMILNIALADTTHVTLGLMCGLYLVFVLFACQFFSRLVAQSHRLRFENADLIVELQKQRDAATHANDAKTRFLAAASHDLRQPLNAVSLYLYSVLQEPLTAQAKRLTENARASVSALAEMLAGLLDTARLETGAMTPVITTVPLAPIFARISVDFQPVAERRGLKLVVRSTARAVRSDSVFLERIVRNLVGNAVAYTASGGVLLGVRTRHGRLVIEVWDTGIGVADDEHTKIFSPYFRAENGRRANANADGVGLGLSIAKDMALALNAQLLVSSRLGRGSCFSVVLDAAVAAPTASDVRAAPPVAERATHDGAWVAFIDDDLASFDALVSVLASTGVRVVAALDADRLHDQLSAEASAPMAIVSDYRLAHGDDGITLVSNVRELFNADVPALIITGDIDPRIDAQATLADITLLRKPVAPERLLAFLRNAKALIDTDVRLKARVTQGGVGSNA